MPDDGITLVFLTKGRVAIIDSADAELVLSRNWRVSESNGKWYACLKGPQANHYLHRILMDAPQGMTVDHINGNSLDCRRSNMRVCTKSQNNANMRKHRDNRSGFIGVRLHRSGNTWQARFKGKHLGCYSTAEEAAKAYDEVVKEAHGEFAHLNFPPS